MTIHTIKTDLANFRITDEEAIKQYELIKKNSNGKFYCNWEVWDENIQGSVKQYKERRQQMNMALIQQALKSVGNDQTLVRAIQKTGV